LKTTNMVKELLGIFEKLDSQLDFVSKLTVLAEGLSELPECNQARLLFFSDDRPIDEQGPAFSVPFQAAAALPKKPAVVCASSPLQAILLLKDSWLDNALYYPFFNRRDDLAGAVIIQADNPDDFLLDYNTELGLLASKLMDIVEILDLRDSMKSFTSIKGPQSFESSYNTSQLLESLSLPMYVTDFSGRFTFVNRTFLQKFQYASIDELNSGENFFIDREARHKEISLLAQQGRLHGYEQNIRRGDGSAIQVRDSVIFMGTSVVGVLYDVSEFVQLNQELQDALQIQELLNDKLISSSLVLQKTQTAAIKSLARLAEYRDRETGDHLQRICEFTGILTTELMRLQPYSFSITEQYSNDMYVSSMLHDIGKVAVPDRILLKEGSLDTDEWKIMKKHTLWGWNILNQADRELGEQSFLTLAARISLHHHERWDGSGYPYGLSGEDIPLSARIEAVADVYDALTSKRSYKTAWPHEIAMEEIERGRGTQFDPVLVDIALENEGQFKMIRRTFSQ
jgi:PAS domain S-box-containing protein